jgi:L-asparaginase
MKRIMVVFTGGTIGSLKQGHAIDVNSTGSYMIIQQYEELYGEGVTFHTMQPMNLLSENLHPQQWLELAHSIRSIPQEQYDGIIVTHGSDTLAYSAAMLGYLLSATLVPIVLIASNYPLGDERANGLRNFREATLWIQQQAPAGVFAVYENDRGECRLYLATRMMQCEPFTDQFRSPYELTLGILQDGELLPQIDLRNPETTQLSSVSHRWVDELSKLKFIVSDILYIKPYPGLNYELYQWGDNKPRAIVHDLYHSATAYSLPHGEASLPAFITRCKQQGIDVYLTPAKSLDEAQYASTARLLDAGAILLVGIAPEAALTKLMLAHSLLSGSGEIIAFMKDEELYYELHREQA